MFRTFIAIALCPEEREALSQLIEHLKENQELKNLKWVKPDNLHLTLHFLGNISKETIERLIPELTEFTAEFSSCVLHAEELRLFPNHHHPRVLALEYAVPESIKELHEKLKALLIKYNIPAETRPLRIHLTLARVKHAMKELPELDMQQFQLSSQPIKLYHSTRNENGLVYVELSS